MDYALHQRIITVFGIISVFTCGYFLNDLFKMKMIQIEERISNVRILQDYNQSHKCFVLSTNTTYFRSVVDSLSSIKNNSCRLITNEKPCCRAGNQMFQVASMFGIASDLDMVPVINVNHFSIAEYFNFPNTVTSDISDGAMCYEEGYTKYSSCSETYENAKSQNIILQGYRQSWKYITRAATRIRYVFTFKAKYMKQAKWFISNNTVLGHDNVCIHVRRGDMLEPHHQAHGYAVADYNYLSKAMRFYESKLKRVRFIVLSDDIVWCMNNIEGNVTFSPYKDPGFDLAVMSLCDHVIMTSGTFGWWGAWLANGMVVYFHGFPANGSDLYGYFNGDDYYPPNWIPL